MAGSRLYGFWVYECSDKSDFESVVLVDHSGAVVVPAVAFGTLVVPTVAVQTLLHLGRIDVADPNNYHAQLVVAPAVKLRSQSLAHSLLWVRSEPKLRLGASY